ncbi:hypothetical protein QL996_13390 [Planococcus sp. APC 4015]|nr:hypothetical protein [Planococcus sp. APC 4015]
MAIDDDTWSDVAAAAAKVPSEDPDRKLLVALLITTVVGIAAAAGVWLTGLYTTGANSSTSVSPLGLLMTAAPGGALVMSLVYRSRAWGRGEPNLLRELNRQQRKAVRSQVSGSQTVSPAPGSVVLAWARQRQRRTITEIAYPLVLMPFFAAANLRDDRDALSLTLLYAGAVIASLLVVAGVVAIVRARLYIKKSIHTPIDLVS